VADLNAGPSSRWRGAPLPRISGLSLADGRALHSSPREYHRVAALVARSVRLGLRGGGRRRLESWRGGAATSGRFAASLAYPAQGGARDGRERALVTRPRESQTPGRRTLVRRLRERQSRAHAVAGSSCLGIVRHRRSQAVRTRNRSLPIVRVWWPVAITSSTRMIVPLCLRT
jgi:hypothetical protein